MGREVRIGLAAGYVEAQWIKASQLHLENQWAGHVNHSFEILHIYHSQSWTAEMNGTKADEETLARQAGRGREMEGKGSNEIHRRLYAR